MRRGPRLGQACAAMIILSARGEEDDRLLGLEVGADMSTVTVRVRRLREKIERDPSDPRLVVTVRGTGYRVDAQAGS